MQYHRLCAEAGIERERLLREQRLKREQEVVYMLLITDGITCMV